MKNFAWIITLGLMISACGSALTPTVQANDVSTIVAGTMQALSPTAPAVETGPTQASGTQVSLNNISFVIPTGIASGALAEPQEEIPPSADMPWWEIHPAYIEYPFQGYVLSNTFHIPKIYVYPVDEFIQMNEDVGVGIEKLKSILSMKMRVNQRL